MRGNTANKWLGTALATLLLLQLSYPTIHVFSSHCSHTHFEATSHNSPIDDTCPTCELYAKLLGKTFFLWPMVFIPLGILIGNLIIASRTYVYVFEKDNIHTLRGPPYPLS